jgi:hypothetical protein
MTVSADPGQPGLVFAPARPRVGGARRDVVYEMRRQPDGALVLPVFSSLAGLVERLGQYQPWACVPLDQVTAAVGGGRVAQVLVDPEIDPQAWRWAEASLSHYGPRPGRHALPKLGSVGARLGDQR